MPAFFEDIEDFRGDGSKNEKGETLDEFLEKYNPAKYPNPCCTVDIVVFGYSGKGIGERKKLKVLLIRRRNHPSIGEWALPGGFIDLHEEMEESAKRELFEETHIRNVTVEQIGAFGSVKRDPRARIITTAFMSLVCLDEVEARAGDDAKDAAWFEICLTKQKRDRGAFYEIELSNPEKGLVFRPKISLERKGVLIREKRVAVQERDHIASDHAAILLQAFLKIYERIEGNTSIEGDSRNYEME